MLALLIRFLLALRSVSEARASREAEILVLRQQLLVLSRRSRKRVRLRNIDRLILVWLCRLFPSLLDAMVIVKPETVLRWHRRGFRAYWRWKSWRRGGRPRIDRELRALIRRMSKENPTWGAPRIHGELLMLGIDVSESTVGRYMIRIGRPRSQGWKTFLRNHACGNRFDRSVRGAHDLVQAALWPGDSWPCPKAAGQDRSDQQSDGGVDRGSGDRSLPVERSAASPDPRPRWRVRARHTPGAFVRWAIRDHPVAARSPWQNGHVERLIGSIRRECLDHLMVSGEAHLRRILKTYAAYYNEVRTHLSLEQRRAELSTLTRSRQRRRDADPGRAPSSIRSGLKF